MSGHNDQNNQNPNFQSNNPYNNPWSDQTGSSTYNTGDSQQYQAYSQQPQQQQQGGFTAPPGPPPGQAPKRSETFKAEDFVPANERGEQREVMEQFEMNHSGNESQQDRDVAELQRQFPGLDGSLIAALYSDAGSMGATREMLTELASQDQGGK